MGVENNTKSHVSFSILSSQIKFLYLKLTYLNVNIPTKHLFISLTMHPPTKRPFYKGHIRASALYFIISHTILWVTKFFPPPMGFFLFLLHIVFTLCVFACVYRNNSNEIIYTSNRLWHRLRFRVQTLTLNHQRCQRLWFISIKTNKNAGNVKPKPKIWHGSVI